jgi:hypothetical protein
MIWKTKNLKQTSKRCLKRMIPMTDEMNKFLQEIINGGTEELYNCVGEKFPEILEGKVEECFMARLSTNQDLSNVSRSILRSIQECDKEKCWCTCNIYSSYVYGLD